jgi:hypothetical protein
MFEAFLQGLRQPKYIHVLINPLPLYGLLIGLLAMVVALILGSRPAQVTALILILLAATSAWPVARTTVKKLSIAWPSSSAIQRNGRSALPFMIATLVLTVIR